MDCMRALQLLLLGVLACTGCSMTVSESIPSAQHGKLFAVHFVPSEKLQPPGEHEGRTVDLAASTAGITVRSSRLADGPVAEEHGMIGGVIAAALRIPPLLDGLRRDLVVVGLGLGTIGAVNIAAMGALIRRKRATSVQHSGDGPRPIVLETIEAGEVETPLRCSCSAPISTRSRTGRCRRCARNARSQSASLPTVELPLTLTISAASDVDDDAVGVPRTAVLKSSRIGNQTAYYSITG